ncbi:MAG TPA: hypothetical protein VG605_10510 [Puia sp.]|nr:hypothetical protein [Puia sp.]
MRNVVCVLLIIVLCSNECNAPYRAKIVCDESDSTCRVRLHNSLEFLMNGATVGWWKGSLGISIYYRGRNTSGAVGDSIDYSRFSVVSSNGIKFYQAGRKTGAGAYAGVYTYAAGAAVDTSITFYSVDKYPKARGMEILKHERFFLVYADGRMDTLVTVMGDDSRMR